MKSGDITSDMRQSLSLGNTNTKLGQLELASCPGTQMLLEHLICL